MSLRNAMSRIKMWVSIPGFVVRRLHWNDAFGVLLVGVKTLAASRAACSETVASASAEHALTRDQSRLLLFLRNEPHAIGPDRVEIAFEIWCRHPSFIFRPESLAPVATGTWRVLATVAGIEAAEQALKRFEEEDKIKAAANGAAEGVAS